MAAAQPTSAASREPRHRRRARTPGVVHRVEGYRIHTVEHGTGEEAVVLIHGLSGSSRWWARNIPELAERYRVVLPDLVGFGRSPRPGLRLPRLRDVADLLVRWMDGAGLERAHLIGHSMGGQLATHLAARHPDRVDHLVLVSAAGVPRPLTPRSLIRFGMDIMPLWRWGDPKFLPTIVGDAWTAGPLTLLQAIGDIVLDDVRPLLPRISAPTLVVWGERDPWVPLDHAWEFRSAIPDARLAVLRRASHVPMVDRPADFNRLVLRFLGGEPVGH